MLFWNIMSNNDKEHLVTVQYVSGLSCAPLHLNQPCKTDNYHLHFTCVETKAYGGLVAHYGSQISHNEHDRISPNIF